jgi:hypothetical protein
MNEGGESVLSIENRKRKRRSGFRYSSKKALERSRLSKSNAKAGGSGFTCVSKVLTYPNTSEPALLESVNELSRIRIETSNSNLVCEFPQRVSNI